MKNNITKALFGVVIGLCIVSESDAMRRYNLLRQTEFINYTIAELSKSDSKASFNLTLDNQSFQRENLTIYLAFWNCGYDEDDRQETVYLHAHYKCNYEVTYLGVNQLDSDSWGHNVIQTWVMGWLGN